MGMTTLEIVIFVVGSISFWTFVAFFGRLPAFKNTIIGRIQRLVFVHLPSFLHKLDVRLTNGRISNGGSRFGHYLMHEKHPLVVIFFLGLVTGSVALFVPVVWHHLPLKHKLLIPVLVPTPYIFTFLSATRNSESYITPENHAAQMRLYPYDRVLYYPGNTCSTCEFLKPARSKHCSICKTCVARMDHHCIWVNNCLGKGNYRWFLLLLFFTTVALAYGAYLAYMVISPLASLQYLRNEKWYRYRIKPGVDPNSWGTYLSMKLYYFMTFLSIYLEIGGLRASGVGLLALLTWPLPLGLLAYHIYLIWAGMTTNESSKWADWRDDMAEGVVYLGHRMEDTMGVNRQQAASSHHGNSSPSSKSNPTAVELPSEEEEPTTTWPLESRHILIRTTNGLPPRNLPSRIRSVAKEDSFEKVWNLGAVENTFDLGFWDNLVESFK
ncbi:palmitoyltransferase swf1 [Aaosphaeria arxii CBS 175.79]|uniref:Palmitoyltransferase n=1 Tax=Aaosphaeria arxii CBS 175.79 TaxID=1450172 RepID=A0A6A5X964_9PLEO|nr:palmitoyltransferase swf1 [Aaosphaeria arxii CBS 175.79]KAF2009492.1 palmitoyltransferase swf1 [Aaosphaeria arxii CBS 175.79]